MDDMELDFDSLNFEYRDKTHRLCCSYVKSEEDRRDLLQEILIKIHRGLPASRLPEQPESTAEDKTMNISTIFLNIANQPRLSWDLVHPILLDLAVNQTHN